MSHHWKLVIWRVVCLFFPFDFVSRTPSAWGVLRFCISENLSEKNVSENPFDAEGSKGSDDFVSDDFVSDKNDFVSGYKNISPC